MRPEIMSLVKTLRRERAELDRLLTSLTGQDESAVPRKTKTRKKLSAATREKMRVAQRRRHANARAAAEGVAS